MRLPLKAARGRQRCYLHPTGHGLPCLTEQLSKVTFFYLVLQVLGGSMGAWEPPWPMGQQPAPWTL